MKKTLRKTNKGVSLLEVMTVIAVIGILASVVTVSLSEGKRKAQASSALQSMSSVAPLAYKCLAKGGTLNKTGSICSINEFSSWPDISSTGWTSSIHWCQLDYSGYTDCGSVGINCGYNASKKFCYAINNGTKHIWCTDNGCQKSGF
jgi:prepilin-type N-terminal cleavage/methylation domain-containing protein